MAIRARYRIAVLCFCLALLLRLAVLFATGRQPAERTEMMSVASTFARTGQIANPYMALPTGPTAHVGPIYPMLIGYVYRALGEGETGETAKQILGCVISSGRSFLVVLLAVALGLGEGTALWAGLISALYIGAFETELKGDWEGPLAADALILLILWGYRRVWQRKAGVPESVLYGAGWGLALLIAPSLAVIGVGLAVLAFFATRPAAWRTMAMTLLCAATGCGLALSPWIIRNHRELGGFVWGRDNFGLELSVSNGPRASWTDSRNAERMHMMHPSRSLPAAEKLLAQGEIAFNRDRKQEAMEWIRQNPREFAKLTMLHTVHFWFPPGRNLPHGLILGGFTLLAFAGLWCLWRQSAAAGAIVTVLWIVYPLIYYVIQWSSRYRQPLEWSFALCAGAAVSTIVPWRQRPD
jgi:hypothetical protein